MSGDALHFEGFGWNTAAGGAELARFAISHMQALSHDCGIRSALDVLAKAVSEGNPAPSLEEAFGELKDPVTGFYGPLGLVSVAIAAETGIAVGSVPGGSGSLGTLMMPKKYPWEMTESERDIDEDGLRAILAPYAVELGDDPCAICALEFDY